MKWKITSELPVTNFFPIPDLSDVANEGIFIDSAGNKPSYIGWYPGEPNYSKNNEDDYVTFNLANGNWIDLKGTSSYRWIENDTHTICQLIC